MRAHRKDWGREPSRQFDRKATGSRPALPITKRGQPATGLLATGGLLASPLTSSTQRSKPPWAKCEATEKQYAHTSNRLGDTRRLAKLPLRLAVHPRQVVCARSVITAGDESARWCCRHIRRCRPRGLARRRGQRQRRCGAFVDTPTNLRAGPTRRLRMVAVVERPSGAPSVCDGFGPMTRSTAPPTDPATCDLAVALGPPGPPKRRSSDALPMSVRNGTDAVPHVRRPVAGTADCRCEPCSEAERIGRNGEPLVNSPARPFQQARACCGEAAPRSGQRPDLSADLGR